MQPTDYEVSIDISIRNNYGQGNLSIRETVVISDCTFDDMAGILKGFHELAQAVKAAKQRKEA